MEVRDALKRAILAIENDVLGVLDLITIPWDNDCYLFDRGIRSIVAPSITVLIKMERDCTLLFWGQMSS